MGGNAIISSVEMRSFPNLHKGLDERKSNALKDMPVLLYEPRLFSRKRGSWK